MFFLTSAPSNSAPYNDTTSKNALFHLLRPPNPLAFGEPLAVKCGRGNASVVPITDIWLIPRDRVAETGQQFELGRNTCPGSKAANTVNDKGPSNHRRKRQRTLHESLPASSGLGEEDTSNPADDNFAYQAGRQSFFVHGLWLHTWEDLFSTNFDDQGNVVKLSKIEESMHCWLQRHFMRGLDTQRHDAATWIRQNCARELGVTESDLSKSDVRGTKFQKEIGWVCEMGRFSSFDVPLLHKDWRGAYSPSSVFLNPKLMGIYRALIHGPSAVAGFMNARSVQAQTATIAQIYKIRKITPGIIATCAILARWSLSADDTLEEVGAITNIHYFDDFEKYQSILDTGLPYKMPFVVNIMEQWDKEIFPVEY